MPPRVARAMSRSACNTVSVAFAERIRLRSPWHCAGSSASFGNVVIGFSLAGLSFVRP
jgi:hypothetical protein